MVLLARTTPEHCVVQQVSDHDIEALRLEAIEATEGAGPEPRLFDERFFLGDREEAIAAFRGGETVALSPDMAWYLSAPEDTWLTEDDRQPEGEVELVAVGLMELESADGRPVWWRSRDYVAVKPSCG